MASKIAPQFVDFILSLFISLLSYLVAHFIADHVVYGLKLKLWFLGGWLPFPQSGCLYSSRAFLGVGASYLLAGGCASGALDMRFFVSW
ncbi:hypothetical protein F2Q69_00001943 [Brassica cretica]|uniref:Uncharacterized protein n=1 Tax=Brassica cretica TaxID=69181 RepID=A0A8S9NMS3_BRACR|nr:hypothetical protein F2Q69_00001943 [Brassica cretica]